MSPIKTLGVSGLKGQRSNFAVAAQGLEVSSFEQPQGANG